MGNAKRNLETVCADYGSAIERRKGGEKEAKRLETIIRNALGVLREDGVFAFYLFLQYRKNEGGEIIQDEILKLWRDDAVGPLLSGDGDARKQVIALTDDLTALLLAREVAERTLIYALYGLRGKE